jgi:hypothetical protein
MQLRDFPDDRVSLLLIQPDLEERERVGIDKHLSLRIQVVADPSRKADKHLLSTETKGRDPSQLQSNADNQVDLLCCAELGPVTG